MGIIPDQVRPADWMLEISQLYVTSRGGIRLSGRREGIDRCDLQRLWRLYKRLYMK